MRAFKSGGLVATSAVVSASAALLGGVTLVTDGTNAASVILYDNATAGSGTELVKLTAAATSSSESITFSDPGIPASAGIYATLAANSACIVYYR